MSGRIAIDFGTSNTVLAVWDEGRREGVPFALPDYARPLPSKTGEVPVVPSLIHYAEDRRKWIGGQVLRENLYHSHRTFRWMKRYVASRSPTRRRLDGRDVSPFDAGRDFLSAVLTVASSEMNLGDEEIALTVPVERYEHYQDWLTGVVTATGLARWRLIDEPSAAILGYGACPQPGKVYLCFDFGGGTLDVVIVLIEEQERAHAHAPCRVLGKAGAELGGCTIDQWLFEEVLARNGRRDTDEDVRKVSGALLVECERAKETLSERERADVAVTDPHTGATLSADFTRDEFEKLLDRHEADRTLNDVIDRALKDARERGFDKNDVAAVLMVGGSSQMPYAQRVVQGRFAREKVLIDRPLDAVARGAAAFITGVDFYDHIQHDYAIRWVNPEKGDYDYRIIVARGTPYPTREPIARLRVKSSHDGQTHLGIAIFELGEHRLHGGGRAMELVFDPSGAARVIEVSPDGDDRRTQFWLNERTPTFLVADPPAAQGEARFAAEFGIDANKRLVLTARDLRTGRTTHRDYPVVKLT